MNRYPKNQLQSVIRNTTAVLTCFLICPATGTQGQQQPDKRSPVQQGGSGQSAENYAGASGSANAHGQSGFSSQSSADSSGCICARNANRRRLFQRKCKVHPNVDAAAINNPFEEIPLGLQMTETMKVQVRIFEDTRQIFYHYDFIDGTPQLNFAGKSKLARISQQALGNFMPVIIEATPRQPGLDQTRRLNIVQTLASNAIPIPPERVIVNGPQARGTVGPDALILYNRALSDLNQSVGGMSGSSGGGGVGGLSGSGLLPNMQQAGSGGGNNGN
ncbi:MAG: hypothetical protein ACKO0V_04630 [bacterium]